MGMNNKKTFIFLIIFVSVVLVLWFLYMFLPTGRLRNDIYLQREDITRINKEYPIEVDYLNKDNPLVYDDMKFNMDGEELTITQKGQVTKKDGTMLFSLGNEYYIERLFFYRTGVDVIAISQETDQDGGWGKVKRFSISSGKMIWEAYIPGFNLGTPVVVDNNLYVSAIGFIGKLDLSTGQYVWSFDDLYGKDGKYSAFDEPTFDGDKVTFLTIVYEPERRPNVIVVDDRWGKIINKD